MNIMHKIELGKEQHELVRGPNHALLIVFYGIDADPCPSNPCTDQDGFGHIYSFCSRHCNFKDPRILSEDFFKDNPHCIPLSYFEHGECLWGVAGTLSNTPDFRWDGVEIAGYWEPDKCLLDEVTELTPEAARARMEEFATQACETYTQWCNGEGSALYDRRSDYRYSSTVLEDSLGGLYGWDYAESELNTALANGLEG